MAAQVVAVGLSNLVPSQRRCSNLAAHVVVGDLEQQNLGIAHKQPQQRRLRIWAAAREDPSSGKQEKKAGAGGLFGFVTDNKSSRDAIQLPNTPAQDGNLGQMITEIENKGREFGFYARADKFTWWVRQTGSGRKGTVVLLHGSPTQSYSYRVLLAQLAQAGYECYAPDWIGYGFSEKPQPGYDFKYTEGAYHEEFDKLLVRLKIKSPFFLLTQGFLVGSYGLTWALKNPQKISKLAILNSPLTASAPLPGLFQQLRLPLLGEFTSQNAVLPERFVEGGSPYVLEIDDADVYRLPYLNSSDAGFSLLESARKAPLKDLTSRIARGFSSKSWKVPTLVAWGEADKYLAKSEAEEFSKSNPDVIKASFLSGAGHLPQEDWPEKVVEALRGFFR
ncbi:unnamed protein product [Calypogeia fissa]